MTSWEREEWICIDRGSQVVQLPESGETSPVLLEDVLMRRVWFPDPGIYILRNDTGGPAYIGMTSNPLRLRLLMAKSQHKPWTKVDHTGWTVTMQRLPGWPNDRAREKALIDELKPTFNVMGRPRKIKSRVLCRCKGPCPECGLQRGTAGGTRKRKVPRGTPQQLG